MVSFTEAFLLSAREGGGGKDFEHPVYDYICSSIAKKNTLYPQFRSSISPIREQIVGYIGALNRSLLFLNTVPKVGENIGNKSIRFRPVE